MFTAAYVCRISGIWSHESMTSRPRRAPASWLLHNSYPKKNQLDEDSAQRVEKGRTMDKNWQTYPPEMEGEAHMTWCGLGGIFDMNPRSMGWNVSPSYTLHWGGPHLVSVLIWALSDISPDSHLGRISHRNHHLWWAQMGSLQFTLMNALKKTNPTWIRSYVHHESG